MSERVCRCIMISLFLAMFVYGLAFGGVPEQVATGSGLIAILIIAVVESVSRRDEP